MPYAMQIPRAGGPDVFERIEAPRPVPGPGQVLVRVAAIGMNFIETYQRAGVYAVDYPFVPGVEAAGTVVDLGPGVAGLAPGDRVATTEGTGSYAEYMLLDADKALPVPDRVPDDVAGRASGAGHHRALPHHLELPRAARRYRPDLRRGGGSRAPADPDAQAARRGGDHDDVDPGEGRARAGRRRRPRPRVRGGAPPRARADRRPGRRRRLRRRRQGHLRGVAGLPARARHTRALRRRVRAGPAVRPPAAQRPRVPDRHAPQDRRLPAHRAGAALALRRGLRTGRRGRLKVTIGARFPLERAGGAHAALESRATTGKVILLPAVGARSSDAHAATGKMAR